MFLGEMAEQWETPVNWGEKRVEGLLNKEESLPFSKVFIGENAFKISTEHLLVLFAS
jgi:hypothetical protein